MKFGRHPRQQPIARKLFIGGLAATALLGITALLWIRSEIAIARQAAKWSAEARIPLLDEVIKLRGDGAESYIAASTYWDGLVERVQQPDSDWLRQNLEEPGRKYGIASLAIFNKDWKQVYTTPGSKETSVVSAERVRKLFSRGGPYQTNFVMNGPEVLEVRAARIHKSDDPNHSGPFFGYAVFTIPWNRAFLQDLSLASGATTVVEPVGQSHVPDPESFNTVRIPIANGSETVAYVAFRIPNAILQRVYDSSVQGSLIFLVVTTIVIASFAYLTSLVVVRPINAVSSALIDMDAGALRQLETGATEISQLAASASSELALRRDLDGLNTQLAIAVNELQDANQKISDLNRDLDKKVLARTKELEQAIEATIHGWSQALESRDHETEGHSQRVAAMAIRIAQALDMGIDSMRDLYYGALLHDIGKIGIPDFILHKPAQLSDDEFELMKSHTTLAHEMLKGVPFLKDAIAIAHYHHERWDGTGYPCNLKGDQIPFLARIFAIADVWDALRSTRPYRVAWSEEQTRAYIAEQSGTHFDPYLVEVFLGVDPMPHPTDMLFPKRNVA